MEIKQCIMTNSLCYRQAGNVPQHFGIVVHSTGVNQPRISRYVQPSDDDPNKDAIIADIGKNPYHNDWNHPPANPTAADRKGVHCFIGNNAAGQVVCYQVLPWDNIAWGVWKGPNGSYNDNPPYFQFEICEDGLTNEKYFNDCMTTAQMLCAYLCNNFELSVENIVSHYESWEQGYGNKHVDPNNWLTKFGKDMNWFRDCVRKMMGTVVAPGDDIKVGDICRLKDGAHCYTSTGMDRGHGFSSWVYESDVIVGEINGDVAHISTDFTLKSYTGWCALADLTRVEPDNNDDNDNDEDDDNDTDEFVAINFPCFTPDDDPPAEAVLTLQALLDSLGFGGNGCRVPFTGFYDDATIYALNAYKKHIGFEPNGIVDADTLIRLFTHFGTDIAE